MYKLIKILTFLILAAGKVSFALECFSEHLKEAIDQNRNRRELYASISDNRSKFVSNGLIFGEKIAYLYSKGLNKKLKTYRDAGVPILCLDFIEMSKAPNYQGYEPPPLLKYSEVEKVDIESLKKTLKRLLRENKYNEITDLIKNELSNTLKYDRYNCLFKHVLESLGRTAFLTPHYIEHAQSIGLKSPEKILIRYLKMNIGTLNFSHYLDKRASTLQEKGIGILCRDVPHIPLRLDYEMELSKY